jgi:hypothetical protein
VKDSSQNIKMIGVFGLLGFATLALALVPAYAQDAPALPFNLPPEGTTVAGPPKGVSVVAAPPAGFNPLTASPAAKAKFAIPPAPDVKAAPEAYNKWQQAVSAIANPQNRVQTTLTQTNIFHGPARKIGPSMPSGTANNAVTTTSSNWSGDAVSNPNKPFTVEAIIGTFVVPTALQAFGSCTGGWDYSALWTGIDGFNSADVLQAGVEVDAYCSGGQAKSFYSAWIEWYPNSSTRVSFPINPGDLVLAEVWNTSPTNGYAYFHNYSTGQVVEYQLTAPLGTSLVGNSVEWMVERPTVFGGLATLTNYIDSAWPNGIALNYQAATPTYQYQGQTPAAGTLNAITMVDNNGNSISSATIENSDFLWFRDFGSAA